MAILSLLIILPESSPRLQALGDGFSLLEFWPFHIFAMAMELMNSGPSFADEITSALRTLLSEKHLYQSVEVSTASIDRELERSEQLRRRLEADVKKGGPAAGKGLVVETSVQERHRLTREAQQRWWVGDADAP